MHAPKRCELFGNMNRPIARAPKHRIVRALAKPVPKRHAVFCITATSFDDDGLIRTAKIVPPTSQNQSRIEQDLWNFAPRVANLPLEDATWKCEQAARNCDPCISCSTHFLTLQIDRELFT